MSEHTPNAPRLKLLSVECFESPYRLRLPFRFGVITVTQGRQAIVRVRLRREDGREATGYAAEALGAKWFDKNPALSDAQNLHQLRKALELATQAYQAAPWLSAFGLFAEHYRPLLEAGAALGLNPLVTSYGPALLDRAVLDALCRSEGLSFWQAMQHNLPGLREHAIAPDLQGFAIGPFLGTLAPAARIAVRHTVGLLDPITAADQPEGSRVNDGLPETLEEVVAAYGNRFFKLKVGGDLPADLERLRRIAGVLDALPDPYAVTLDGNEQYPNAEAAAELWRRMASDAALQRLCAATLFIEQPIHRQAALSQAVAALGAFKPVIIDESDGELDAFPRARSLGYTGVSTKACKGFYKSVLNLARCRVWNQVQAGAAFFMSAEDLTTQPGLSLQQDLALVSLLGITHVERNAHHFIDGFNGRPEAEARAFLAAHPDLYHAPQGRVRLHIQHGELSLGSLAAPGFGSPVEPLLDATEPMARADWPPAPPAQERA